MAIPFLNCLLSLLLFAPLIICKPRGDSSFPVLNSHHQIRHHKHRGASARNKSSVSLLANGLQMQSDMASGGGSKEGFPVDAFPATNATLQSYVRKNCSSCLAREEAKLARIDRIKQDLLRKLNFAKKPNVSAARDVPNLNEGPIGEIMKRYGLQSDSPSPYRLSPKAEDSSATTEGVYSFARTPPDFGFTTDASVAFFNFSANTMDNEVNSAELKVYLRTPQLPVQETYSEVKLIVYRITSKGRLEQIQAKKIRHNPRYGKWYSIKLETQVRHWFLKPSRNYGIHVSANYQGENLAVHPQDGDSKRNMYLDMMTEEGEKAGRRRRNAPNMDCREDQQERRCCRYPLVINFEEFGWDFVIAPKYYLAWYCSGECPFRYLQRFVHTHLVSQALPDGSAGPCCYPTELAPIMMVYLNEQKEVLVSQVPGMVATRCGCA